MANPKWRVNICKNWEIGWSPNDEGIALFVFRGTPIAGHWQLITYCNDLNDDADNIEKNVEEFIKNNKNELSSFIDSFITLQNNITMLYMETESHKVNWAVKEMLSGAVYSLLLEFISEGAKNVDKVAT